MIAAPRTLLATLAFAGRCETDLGTVTVEIGGTGAVQSSTGPVNGVLDRGPKCCGGFMQQFASSHSIISATQGTAGPIVTASIGVRQARRRFSQEHRP